MTFFTNKTIWITGASSGIGEALVNALTTINCNIIISARRKEELERIQNKQTIAKVKILPLDLAAPDTLPSKTAEAISLFGQIDIMIHNGGISQRSLVEDTPIEIHRKLMEVDYFSYIIITKELLPHFKERKSGHIVVMSSVMGKLQTPMRSSYAAAKHALQGYFDCLRAEVWKYNIDVTIFTPGFIQTNITLNALTEQGKTLNNKGKDISNGYPVEKAAYDMLKAIEQKKNEVFIGKKYRKEHLGLLFKRFFPNAFAKMARKLIPN